MQITFGTSHSDGTPEDQAAYEQSQEEIKYTQNPPIFWSFWASSLSIAWWIPKFFNNWLVAYTKVKAKQRYHALVITQLFKFRCIDSEIKRLQYPYEWRRGLHTSAHNGLGLLRPVRAVVRRQAPKPAPLPPMNWGRIWRFGKRIPKI